MSLYGRYQVAEPPHALARAHLYRGAPLKEVDWEPRISVIDQSNLLAQGIFVDTFILGARRVDALGSCTANGTLSALSNILTAPAFTMMVSTLGGQPPSANPYGDTAAVERAAIGFYHRCTDQTGDPGTEWPPTDCGSSGPYIASECEREGLARGAVIAHGPDNIVSLMQSGGILVGQPFLNAWEQPGPDGFVDGDGSMATLQTQIMMGIAGGHETFISAIEKLVVTPTGVDPSKTVLRVRNSWGSSWGDHGSYRIHLSTYVALGGSCDFRQLLAR